MELARGDEFVNSDCDRCIFMSLFARTLLIFQQVFKYGNLIRTRIKYSNKVLKGSQWHRFGVLTFILTWPNFLKKSVPNNTMYVCTFIVRTRSKCGTGCVCRL